MRDTRVLWDQSMEVRERFRFAHHHMFAMAQQPPVLERCWAVGDLPEGRVDAEDPLSQQNGGPDVERQ